jgi:hypothetical protein
VILLIPYWRNNSKDMLSINLKRVYIEITRGNEEAVETEK